MSDRDGDDGEDEDESRRLQSIALTGLSNAADSTMDRLAGLAARLLGADVGLVSLVDDHRQFFPGQLGLPSPIDVERESPLAPSLCRDLVRRRGVLQIDDLAADDEWPEHDAFTALGVGSYLGAPLVDADDRVLGSFCALGRAPRRWTNDERQLITDLALAASSEIQARITVAEANAARDRSEQSLGRIEMMSDVSSALISTMDPAASIERMLEVIVERFAEWSFVFIAATDDDPAQAFIRHRQPDVGQAIAVLTTDPQGRLQDMAMTRAVLEGTRPFVNLDHEAALEAASQAGASVPIFDELGMGPLMLVPMSIGRRVLGVLAIFGEPHREPFDHVDLILAADLARRAALTFEHRRLYARERYIASELQHALLPQLPDLENPEVDAIYTAATGADVGGDWYDLVELDDGSFLIVVGDVTGHGVQSAAAMGRIQSLMRYLAASGEPPTAILDRVATTARVMLGTLLATCVTCHAAPLERYGNERGGWTLTFANAGHLPPVLIRPDGTSILVELPPGPLIGATLPAPRETSPRETRTVEIESGTILLMYTDGLIESRDEVIDDSIERLRTAAAQLDTTILSTFCRRLTTTVEPDGSDDIACIAVRFH